jgi:hypothetical protein
LKGNGTFDVGASTLTNSGTITPGTSPGSLTIAGNFAQTGTGTLEVEVGGTVQGVDYDVLRVTGNASLGGTLAIKVPAGATVTPTSDFRVITYASHTGDFAAKTAPAGSTFVAAPGPTSYGVGPAAPATTPPDSGNQTTREEANTITTRDALIFSDRFNDPQMQQASVFSSTQGADIERKREALPECR